MVHVPFRSVPQGVTELVAGRIQAMGAVSGAVLPQVREGAVRALGITSEGRFAAAPDIPTFTEQGQGAAIWTWIGLFAPTAMPAERIARLSAEAGRALATPEAQRALTAAGFEIVGSEPGVLRSFVADEITRWGPLIRRLDIRPES
jgi:tripartite-type tricarboxylate transporter receptor subunit TctC